MQQTINRFNDGVIPEWCRYDDTQTKLLLHGDRIGTATEVLDSSLYAHEVNAQYGAHIVTSAYKFPNGSILFDGVDDYLEIPNNEDWWFHDQDWTIDFWTSFEDFSKESQTLLALWNNQGQKSWKLSTEYDYAIKFSYSLDGTTETTEYFYTSLMEYSFYHFEICRHGSELLFFINGHIIDYFSISGSFFESDRPLTIGKNLQFYPDTITVTNAALRSYQHNDYTFADARAASSGVDQSYSGHGQIGIGDQGEREEPYIERGQIIRTPILFFFNTIGEYAIIQALTLRLNIHQFYTLYDTGSGSDDVISLSQYFNTNSGGIGNGSAYSNTDDTEGIDPGARIAKSAVSTYPSDDDTFHEIILNSVGRSWVTPDKTLALMLRIGADIFNSPVSGEGNICILNLNNELKIDYFPNTNFKGWLDEIRISKGIARHTTEFNPPKKAYENPVIA